MIFTELSRRTVSLSRTERNRNCVINGLLKSRNLYNVQTLEYDLTAVCAMDMDPSDNFLLIGLSNGSVDLQGVQDLQTGHLEPYSRINLSPYNLHRVQWFPGHERFFSMLDNHNLYLYDPNVMRSVGKFNFSIKTSWSEWNPNNGDVIAVCGTESQTRLVDVRSGSSVQTIILGAKSGLASHRATRSLWSRQDTTCLIVGDNEGYLHVYDTRYVTRPHVLVGEERGQISGMSFTSDSNTIITSQGTDNQLVEWNYDRCQLKPSRSKFRKRRAQEELAVAATTDGQQSSSHNSSTSRKAKDKKNVSLRKHTRRVIPLPVDAYLRCQFYVTDRHVYCPAPARATKSKELFIYDLESGFKIKTLKSDDILCQGVYSVTGILPESLSLYVGGRGRLRVWSLDENHERRKEEKRAQYHQSRWDSDDDH